MLFIFIFVTGIKITLKFSVILMPVTTSRNSRRLYRYMHCHFCLFSIPDSYGIGLVWKLTVACTMDFTKCALHNVQDCSSTTMTCAMHMLSLSSSNLPYSHPRVTHLHTRAGRTRCQLAIFRAVNQGDTPTYTCWSYTLHLHTFMYMGKETSNTFSAVSLRPV